MASLNDSQQEQPAAWRLDARRGAISGSRVPGGPVAVRLREFPGRTSEVRTARQWISTLLPDCDAREDVLLLASELCANAVTHTRSGEQGGRFSVHVECSPGLVRVVIGDAGSPEYPAVATWADEGGRGLLLVERLADDWGTARHPGGRCTWFDVHWQARGGIPLTLGAGDGGATRIASLQPAGC
jgi:anti-sigma regulatory factor (Ser/Thr protein kinase)